MSNNQNQSSRIRPMEFKFKSKTISSSQKFKTFDVNFIIMNKREIKKQTKCCFGYTQTSSSEDATSFEKAFLTLTPHSVGRLIPHRQKVEYLVGEWIVKSDDQEKPYIIHPLLSYILSCVIFLHHLVGKVKKTKAVNTITEQNTHDLSDKKIIKPLTEHISFLYFQMQKYKSNFSQSWSRIQKLQAFKKKRQQYQEKCLIKMKQYYQKGTFKKPDIIDMNLYLHYLIDSANRIDLLTIPEQSLKLDLLLNKIKSFFIASKQVTKKNNKTTNSIKINRPSVEIIPVLQNLFDQVELRKSGQNYKSESIQIIKSIFLQLKRFQTVTSTENNKNYYEYLSPENIIFDQFKLTPKLHYEPIILDMFGLSLRPTSIQNRIVFNPTPEDFNCFQSVEELLQQNKLKLNDPYYGNIQMYEHDRKSLKQQQLPEVQKERAQIQELKQKMQVHRFLLVSYYLINSNQFGRLDSIGNLQQKKQHFQKTWQVAHRTCSQDMSQLSTFFGMENKKTKNKEFNFHMEQISEYLQIEKNDSLIQLHRNVKTKKYFQLKTSILKQIIRIISCENVFTKIYNVKKHIFIYFLLAMEIIEEVIKLVKTEKQKAGERKNLRIYLQKNLTRQNKDPQHYLQISYQKIQDYKTRDLTNIQAKYLVEDDLGKRIYVYLVSIQKQITSLQECEKILFQIQGLEELKKQNKEQYKQTIKKIDETADKSLEKARDLFLEIFHLQMKVKHRDGPHRLTQEQIPAKQFFKFLTKKFDLLILTFVTLNEQNFIMYESLIAPILKIQQDSSRKKLQVPADLTNLEADNELLQTIQGLMDIRKLTPKKMKYLKKQQSNLNYVQECNYAGDENQSQNLLANDFYDKYM